MQRKTHWNTIFSQKAPDTASWYQTHLEQSLRLIKHSGAGSQAALIDVGGGASTLVDDLLAEGFQDVTVLDVSAVALQIAQQRLGERAKRVTWMEADITDADLPTTYYDLWHDRAVFHFLTAPGERQRYIAAARKSIKVGGSLIIATFAADGPTQCSGLDIARYSVDGLSQAFGAGFDLVESAAETHQTPWQSEQRFSWCRLVRTPD
jgi:SAM-dependent methyltransferase